MSTLIKSREPGMIESLRRELDRFFDDMIPLSWSKINGENGLETWSPLTDMSETDSEYNVVLDLPGIEKKEINVSVQDNRLIITGERKKEENETKRDFMRRERYFGSFYRSFTLPETIKESAVSAQFKDGVLTVTVPKNETRKARSVKVD